MLRPDDLDKLAEWFVKSEYFTKQITSWSSDESQRYGYLNKTTAVARNRVAEDLKKDHDSAKKISKMILQMVTSGRDEYTQDDWHYIISYNGPFAPFVSIFDEDKWKVKSDDEKQIDAHLYFVSEFKDYLNRITVCGVDTAAACDFIISCVLKWEYGSFRFNHDKWEAFVEKNHKEQEHKQLQAEYESSQMLQRKITGMQYMSLQDLIASCTDGLAHVSGKAETLQQMNDFKQAALALLQEPTTLDGNLRFLQLLQDTYRQVHRGVSFEDNGKDKRIALAEAIITHVNNALQTQRKMLEAERDATPVTNAQTEEKPPKKPFSMFDYKTWTRGQEQPSHEHIRQLLSQMQELNSQTISQKRINV